MIDDDFFLRSYGPLRLSHLRVLLRGLRKERKRGTDGDKDRKKKRKRNWIFVTETQLAQITKQKYLISSSWERSYAPSCNGDGYDRVSKLSITLPVLCSCQHRRAFLSTRMPFLLSKWKRNSALREAEGLSLESPTSVLGFLFTLYRKGLRRRRRTVNTLIGTSC